MHQEVGGDETLSHQTKSASTALPGTKKRGKKCLFVLLALGLSMTLLSMTGYALYPNILIAIVTHTTALTGPDSLIYKAWVNPGSEGIPFHRSFVWLNVTNPLEVVAGAEVPNLVPVGPYVYEEQRVKDEASIKFNHENGTVSYTYKTTYMFVPSKSVDKHSGRQLHENDVLSVINMPLFGISHRLSKLPTVIRQFGNFTFSKDLCCWVLDWAISSGFLGPPALGPTGIFVNRTVHELLWGYEDPIWKLVHPVLKMLDYTASTVFSSQTNGTNAVPSTYTFRSGQKCPLWSNESNCNSSTNQVTIEGMGVTANLKEAAGAQLGGRLNSAGNISRWAGQDSLWWMGPIKDGLDAGYDLIPDPSPTGKANESDCTFLEGSEGIRFPPFLKEGGTLSFFLDLAWRKFTFRNKGKSHVKGIETLRYVIDESDLDNMNPRNRRCNQVREYGMFNITHAVFGPGLLTKAFFLDTKLKPSQLNFTLSKSYGGERFTTVPDFLKETYSPDAAVVREELDPHVDIHALSGLTLNGQAKAFVNIPFGPLNVRGCTLVGSNATLFQTTKNLPQDMYLPIAMLERSATVSDHYASKLKFFVLLNEIARPLMLGFAALGCLLSFLGPLRQMVLARRDRHARDAAAEQRRLEGGVQDPSISDSCVVTRDTMTGRSGGIVVLGSDENSVKNSPKKQRDGPSHHATESASSSAFVPTDGSTNPSQQGSTSV